MFRAALARAEEGSSTLPSLWSGTVPDVVELLAEEKLMLVTTNADGQIGTEDDVHVDRGPAFEVSEQAAFPAFAILLFRSAWGASSGRHRTSRRFRRLQVWHGAFLSGRWTIASCPGAPEFSHS